MHFNRTSAILLRQFYLLRGSPARIIPLFGWVAIDIVLWGFITRYLNSVARSGFNFVPALLGAVLLWDFCARVMQGVTTAFLEDVWSRNFLNIFATPLSIWEYVAGLVMSSIATSSVGLVVMLILATTAFGLSFFLYGATLAVFLLVLFGFGIALRIVGSGHRASARARGGMVRLAHSRPCLTICRSLLSPVNYPAMDAIYLACNTAILRVRRNAKHRLGRSGQFVTTALGRGSCCPGYSLGMLVFCPHLSSRCPYRFDRALQRRKFELAATMKRLILLFSIAATCRAADVSGNWAVAVPNGDGTMCRTYFNLNQHDGKITGTGAGQAILLFDRRKLREF